MIVNTATCARQEWQPVPIHNPQTFMGCWEIEELAKAPLVALQLLRIDH